ncbi:GNAT family N-acetyltransferase [Brevibacterium ammoniilyticum]|uniref:GNAT family N-acetyltransferase n=1 Tax=Brevibacterium ammoniilyticum TaxID=1046555 RepID=A0ABP9TXV2_9MICO
MSVHLRAWRPSDAEALAEIFDAADPELLSNIPDDRSATGAGEWLDRVSASESDGTAYACAIVGDDDSLLGNVMASGIERRHSTAWISYWLRSAARGRGLASAALRTLVDTLHDDLEIHRLELGYRVNNPASGMVAKSAGFLVEGREREKLLYDGVRFDTEVAARLATDPRGSGHRLPLRR